MITNKPKFTIITVCLNEFKNIRHTCESICNQSFKDYEWIVIDGYSTDGTRDILSEFLPKIQRFVSEPDNGIYDAMNKGISLARGEYLVFLNAGDYFPDSSVLDIVSRSPEKDVLYGDLMFFSEDSENKMLSWPDKLPCKFLLRNMMPHQATYFRRDLFQAYGGYDVSFKIAGDYDLFARLFQIHKVSSYHVPRVLAVFKTDGISSNPSQRSLRRRENHIVRKKYFPWHVYGLSRIVMEIKLYIGLV